jgi:hypothetical protein
VIELHAVPRKLSTIGSYRFWNLLALQHFYCIGNSGRTVARFVYCVTFPQGGQPDPIWLIAFLMQAIAVIDRSPPRRGSPPDRRSGRFFVLSLQPVRSK